jgi:hypothetical protein
MQESSPEQQAGQDSRSARRRLIRGTFAAPVALTLASGSVAAASLTCVAKRVATPVLPTDGDVTQTWIRVAVWELKPNGANNDSFWISGADIFALAKNPLTSFVQQNQWWCLSKESNAKMNSPAGQDTVTLVAGTAYTPNPSPPQSGSGGSLAIATPSATRLVAVRVNAAGDIIGVVGDGGTAGSGITASCWTSFRR